jgi:2-polyprenyl-3-methyl-5-hydroxy-6-metoxy-1,4-benzoquinol methylase
MISRTRLKMLSISESVASPPDPTLETQPTACSCCGSNASHEIARGRDYIYDGSDQYLPLVACDVCEHIFLNPQPTINALPVMYPNNYGTFSSKFRGGFNLLAYVKNAVNLKRFRRVAGVMSRGMRILDVGCGNGELLRVLAADRPDLELYGLDWRFPADTRRDLEAVGIHLIEGALEGTPLPEKFFDCVLMYQLIEHLWEPAAGLNKLGGSLRPGGIIAVETPDTDGYDRYLFSRGTWGGYYVPRHLNLYNFERLAQLLMQSGLEIVQQKSLPAPVIWCYSLQAVLQEKFGAKTKTARLFDLRNIAALAGFAILDMAAIAVGLKSSNQQTIARKPESG